MKNQDNKRTCGDCLHRHIGIFEIYCHKKDKLVKEDKIACDSFACKTIPKDKYRNKHKTHKITTMEQIQNAIPTPQRDKKGPIRIANLGRKFKTDSQAIRNAASILSIELTTIGEGEKRCKALKREDLPAMEKWFKENPSKTNGNTRTDNTHISSKMNLDNFSDKELVKELRDRGYTVTCTKQITIEL